VRDSDPPRCASHRQAGGVTAGSHLLPAAAAPVGAHGFYGGVLRDDEIGGLVEQGRGGGFFRLDDEIALCRAALRRIMQLLDDGAGPNGTPLTTEQITRLMRLVVQAAQAVARLVKVQHDMGGVGPDSVLGEAIDRVLDNLSEEWGVDL
jgi:hypothetical protein